MKAFFLGLLILCSSFLHAQNIQQYVDQRLENPVLDGAWWGGLAVYTDGNEPAVFAVNPDLRLTPASTLKLLTTAAALETFGPHYRFETNLYASSEPNEKGILKGDLYVQGGGDPTLGSVRVTGGQTWQEVASIWAKAVKKMGITQIDGDIYADVSAFEGPSIAPKVNWENIGNYYAAPASPLCFNDNLFKIFFKPQPFDAKKAEISRTDPEIPQLKISSFVSTDAKNKRDNAYVYGAPNQYEMKIYGTIPTNLMGFSIQAALPDPALFAVQSLHNALRQEGIAVGGHAKTVSQTPDYTHMKRVHTYQSPELKDIIVIVNKRSFNLYAEMLLRQLALHAGKKGSVQNGLEELEKFLHKNHLASSTDTVIYDGSGLSRDNMLTPRVLVNTLSFMTKSPHFNYYYQSLATPDDRGDLLLLRYFLKPKHQIQDVRVKGGTIDGVKAVAGYVHDANGKPIAFALMANNLASKDETILRIHEDIIKQLLQTGSK